jgi:hypothetical protein
MTGLPDLNYPAFNSASTKLRAMGHECYNPAEWEDENNFGKFNHLLAFDDYCKYIVRDADVILLLPGWEDSPGANGESAVGRAVRKPIRLYEEFLNVSHHEMHDYLRFDASTGLDKLPTFITI